MNTNTLPATVLAAKEKFELACKDASALQIVSNFGAAKTAVNEIALLHEAMTDEIKEKIMKQVMNTKIGFLTDRNGRARSGGRAPLPLYTRDIVRDCIIDAVTIGLLPTGNQFNIIAERMYPTKEGYTSLLRKLGVKYFIDTSYDKGQTQNFAEIPCKINYEYNGEKNGFSIIATVKKDYYSSHDQLRGIAERMAKNALYEYITGCDFGDADEQSSVPIVDAVAEEIKEEANAAPTIGVIDGQPIQAQQGQTGGQTAQSEPANPPQAREGRGSNNAKPLF